jgi:23S rRNA (cytidine1920-2'-O)/16S rRNA (cytidine1409-2'-O)-methyltransferase
MVNNMRRLDKELHIRQLVKSRTAAVELIKNNSVTVNGVICNKTSQTVSPEDSLVIIGEQLRYVSRGGLKLEQALNEFKIDLSGKVCLDVGASTGGFTDCMLQHGASRVYAVDVGTSQLDPTLRGDSRVVCMENCDIRKIEIPPVQFTAVDVSFISLKLILPCLSGKAGTIVALIKPQFELGKKHKGVIRDAKLQQKIVDDIAGFAGSDRIIESPIVGGCGNREYLMGINL